jgi:hypothetical protein
VEHDALSGESTAVCCSPSPIDADAEHIAASHNAPQTEHTEMSSSDELWRKKMMLL